MTTVTGADGVDYEITFDGARIFVIAGARVRWIGRLDDSYGVHGVSPRPLPADVMEQLIDMVEPPELGAEDSEEADDDGEE